MTDSSSPDDWDAHWTEYGEAAFRNPAVLYRVALIEASLGSLGEGDRLVDIGCGQGELLQDLSARYPNCALMGIDFAAAGIRLAATRVPGARFHRRDLLEEEKVAPAEFNWATAAVCSEVLEHLDQPEVLLRNAREYLRPGCKLVVTVPGGPMSALDRHIGHRRHFTPELLREVLEAGGYTVDRIDRSGFPFFNLYRLTVVLAGDRLVRGAKAGGDAGRSRASIAERVASRLFGLLFRINLRSSSLGWQLIAVATLPASGS